MVVVNALANFIPFNEVTTAEVSDKFQNYFIPAGYVFSIWGVIYVFTGIYVVYQMLPANRDAAFQKAIGPWFFIGSIANGTWIFLWHWGLIPSSLVAMLVLLISLLATYLRLNIGKVNAEVSWKVRVATQVPFSLYLGWITVATVANVAAVLVNDAKVPAFDAAAITWTVLILSVVALITVLMLWFRKDVIFALVVVWAVAGILYKQLTVTIIYETAIAVTAGIVFGIVAVFIVWTLLKSHK